MPEALVVAALVVIISTVFYAVGRLLCLFPPVRTRWVLMALPPILLASFWVVMACF